MNDPYHLCGFCFWMKINLASTVSIAFSSKLAVNFRVRMAFLSGEKTHALFTASKNMTKIKQYFSKIQQFRLSGL